MSEIIFAIIIIIFIIGMINPFIFIGFLEKPTRLKFLVVFFFIIMPIVGYLGSFLEKTNTVSPVAIESQKVTKESIAKGEEYECCICKTKVFSKTGLPNRWIEGKRTNCRYVCDNKKCVDKYVELNIKALDKTVKDIERERQRRR
jgi:hypothetical protein